ncbi:hypothetical protein ACFS5L_12485 [Streptomyces phyllanthi]|nr:hypothetical protein [Streptomyces phyllanthi]
MRELGALAGALMTVFALVLLGASPSAAGGPTSVLLVSPTSQETSSLYATDERYTLLQDHLGPMDGTLDRGDEEPPKVDETIGHQVNVTWLIHDVTPWRVDQVYPLMPKARGVWIHTARGGSDGTAGTWHKAAHPEKLRGLLMELGVMGEVLKGQDTGSGTDTGTGTDAQPGRSADDDSAAVSTAGDRPPAEAATGLGTNWWWVIPGLVAGVALTSALRPLAARAGWRPHTGGRSWWRQRPEPGPRQELRDV